MVERRESAGFLIKQRAFLKGYLITEIQKGQSYGQRLSDDLQKKFGPFGYEPNLPEIYRSLHELTEDGILRKGEELVEGAKYKKVAVYTILDKDKAKAYMELVKVDTDRSQDLLRKFINDNYA